MRNIQALLSALRRAKFDRKEVDIAGSVFTPEDVQTLLGELYDLLAQPVAAEYGQRFGGTDK